MLIALIGYPLALLSALTILPQSLKTLTSKNFSGLNPITSYLGIITMVSWSIYTFKKHDLPALLSSLGPLIGFILILTAFLLYHEDRVKVSLYLLPAAALITLLVCLNLTRFSAVAGSTLWILPQLYHAFIKHDLKGISTTSYLLLLIENLAWILYGYFQDNVTYSYAPVVQITASLLILWKTHQKK